MKNFFGFFSLVMFLLLQQCLFAQVNIQVSILPPYQSNITIYGSRPDLVLINLVNTSSQELSIQLHGSIVGDNGIVLSSKTHTRSSHPIILPPLGTIQLNGMEISNIFDLNQVNLVGITEQDFISGSGLPEGMYNFCVRAFDYNDLSRSLSAEEPQGCTMLSINSNEPPIITAPYEDQEISEVTGAMGFNISWMTVGAPTGVYYNLKMVEVLGNQNPKDVFESASPIFEMPVQSNFFFYGPQYPQLVAGRRYVLAVQAVDPMQNTVFRNNGRSELVTFTYGGDDIWAAADSILMEAGKDGSEQSIALKEGDGIDDNDFATNRIKGRLLWGFVSKYESVFGKRDQSAFLIETGVTSAIGTGVHGINSIGNPNLMWSQDPTSVGTSFNTGNSTGVAVGVMNTGAMQTGVTGAYMGVEGRGVATGSQYGLGRGMPVVNPRGVTTVSQGYYEGNESSPKGEAPLSGVYVTIKGLKDHSSIVPGGRSTRPITITSQVLLGTGKSDHSGNFEIELTDPKYAKLDEFNRIVMQVNSEDFEPYEFVIDRNEFDRHVNVEIGDHILSAKTFVFEPSFLLEGHANYPSLDSELEVTVYRRTAEIEEHPYLRFEGDLADNERIEKVIDSKKLVPVSRKVISLQNQDKSIFPKLFYSGSLHVEVLPKESFIKERNEVIAVNKDGAVSGKEFVVMPEYLLQMNVPSISGTVRASTSGGASTGVTGAYVQVTFNEEDLVTPSNSSGGMISLPTTTSGLAGSGGNIPLWTTVPIPGGGDVNIVNPNGLVDPGAALSGGGVGHGVSFAIGEDLLNGPAVQTLNDIAMGPGLQPYTSMTYENGEYTIKHLPLLKKGAKYKVRLVEVPAPYRHMTVDTIGRDMSVDLFSSRHAVDFMIDASTIVLKGQVVDQEGNGVYVENLRIRDGISFNTKVDGSFEQEIIVQNQLLDVKGKLGYQDTTVKIEIPDLNNPPEIVDIGKVTLKKKVSRSLFTVVEKNNTSTFLEGVEIRLGDSIQYTNTQGQWRYTGPGGKTLVTFIPPAESGYVAVQLDIELDASGVEKEYVVELEKGVKLYGVVEGAGKVLVDTEIQVDEKEYWVTKTDEEGKYVLYVPNNARPKMVKAAKSGFYSMEKEQLTEGDEVELNFSLKDGEGRNISTLLGFDIQLDNSEEKDGKTLWTGKFVNMQSSSKLFEGSRSQSLSFKNLEVTFDDSGNAVPSGNKVVTGVKVLKLKLFDYLPVLMKGQDDKPLTVVGNPDGHGGVSGVLQVDVAQWAKNEIGVNIGNIKNALLQEYNTTRNVSIEVYHADKNRTLPEVEFVLSKKDTADVSIELFGFKMNMDLTKSIISQNGFSTSGYVLTPEVGIIRSDSIAIEHLKISRQFGLEEVKFSHELPKIKIGNWVASLGTVSMDEFGFKLDGELHLDKNVADNESNGGSSSGHVSEAGQNKISFSKLSFTNTGLFGGTLSLPDEGISVLGLVNAKQGDTPLTFQNKEGLYSIAGSVTFKFEKLIKREIKVSSFQIQSDGQFYAVAPTDYSLDLGFAGYKLQGVEIRNKENEAPSVSLRGEFKVNALNAFKMHASNINFVLDRYGKVDYKIDSIAASFKTPVFDAEFALGILDSTGVKGFNGSGAMNIPNTPIGAALNFSYHKYDKDEHDNNQFYLAAGFRAGATIAIGSVTIDSVGGGFSYNTREKEFNVEVGGNASILNAKHLAQLQDLKLGVTSNSGANSGVIIYGQTNVLVGSIINLAKASITMNTHAKQFVVNVDGQFSPVDNLAKMQINGDLVVQWHPDDTYVFLGAHANANIAGMIKGQADFAIGVNVKNPHSHPMTKKYFTKLAPSLAQNVFTGAYVNGFVEKKIDFEADVWIAAAKLKLESKANAVFYVNFASQRELLLRMDGRLNLEAGVSLLGWNVVGAKAGACYGIGGGYQQSLGGWNFDGYAAVYARVDILRPHSCNDYTLLSTSPGATVCFHAHGKITYRNSLLSMAGGIGKKDDNNCP